MQKQTVLLMSHFFNSMIEEKYRRLYKELDAEQYDVFLLFNTNSKNEVARIPASIPFCAYDPDDLNELGYVPICEKLLPGSCHFPVLRFYKEHAEYSYYWFIEYDVEFTGEWSVLMDGFSQSGADFLGAHIASYDIQRNNNWVWWQTCNHSGYPIAQCIRAFHPICRYSNAALAYIHQYQSRGFSAHSELLIPTCLYNAGFTLEDFGGIGEFVRSGNENRYYMDNHNTELLCTLRYRPGFSNEYVKNCIAQKIYHPVKY